MSHPPPPTKRIRLTPSETTLASIRASGLTINQFGRELFNPDQKDPILKAAGQSFLSTEAAMGWVNVLEE